MLKETGDDLNSKIVVRQASALLSLCCLAGIVAISLVDFLELTAQYKTPLRALAGFSGLALFFVILNRWAAWRGKAEPASHHPSVAYPEQVSQVPVTYLLLCLMPAALLLYVIESAFHSGEPIWKLDHFDSDAALWTFLVVVFPQIAGKLFGRSGQ